MKKVVLVIVILIAILVSGPFLAKVLATPLSWQKADTTGLYKALPNSKVIQPTNEESGSWYCPMDPNYQPKYDWYNSPQVPREWWCW